MQTELEFQEPGPMKESIFEGTMVKI